MRPEEVARARASSPGEAAAGLAAQVREIHEGIADRVFGVLGPAGGRRSGWSTTGSPAGAYAAARALTGRARARRRRRRGATRPRRRSVARGSVRPGGASSARSTAPAATPRAAAARSALPMTLRAGGRDVAREAASLARRLPGRQPRLAVFLHGLCETDDAWRLRCSATCPTATGCGPSSATRPLYVRYNSGRHISENGRELARLLERAGRALAGRGGRDRADRPLDGRPGGPQRLPLRRGRDAGASRSVTCSRSARRTAARRSSWSPTPPARALAAARDARRSPAPLKLRSAGIKDLGYGYLVDEDWRGPRPRRVLRQHRHRDPVPATAPTTTSCRATLVARRRRAGSAGCVGDLLVSRASAWAHERPRRAAALPDRPLPPPRRRQPLRPAQPPGDLRRSSPLAGAHGAAGAGRPR